MNKRKNNLVWTLVFILCLLQSPLLKLHPFFSFLRYLDDAAAVFFFMYCIKEWMWGEMRNDLKKMLFCLFAIIAVGILSTYLSNVRQPLFAQLLDIVFLTKVFFCFIGSYIYFQKRNVVSNIVIFRFLAKVSKIIVLAGIIMYPLIYLGQNWLYNGIRNGLKCYCFIYQSAGMLSQYCIAFMIILTCNIGLSRKRSAFNWFCLYGLMFIWLMSLRSRAIMIVFVFFVLLFIINKKRYKLSTSQILDDLISLKYIVPLALVSLYMTIDQIFHYYDAEEQARYVLLHGGLSVFLAYFPWGAGWATFGTEPAATFYSPLYYKYSISTHWALVEGGTELTDNYWPAVMAELGIGGVLFMGYIIYLMSKVMLKNSLYNLWAMVAMLTYVIFLLASSTATCCYSSPTTTCFVIIVGLILNCNIKKVNGKNCFV